MAMVSLTSRTAFLNKRFMETKLAGLGEEEKNNNNQRKLFSPNKPRTLWTYYYYYYFHIECTVVSHEVQG